MSVPVGPFLHTFHPSPVCMSQSPASPLLAESCDAGPEPSYTIERSLQDHAKPSFP